MESGKLNILGTEYTVKLYPWDEDQETYGQTLVDHAEIRLNSRKSPDTYRDTLLHEIIHALQHGLDIPMTEAVARRLATGLLTFFKANPKVAQWIVK